MSVYFAFMLVLMMAVLRLRLLEPPVPHAGNIVVGIPALIETLVSAVHRGSWHCIPSFGGLPASASVGEGGGRRAGPGSAHG